MSDDAVMDALMAKGAELFAAQDRAKALEAELAVTKALNWHLIHGDMVRGNGVNSRSWYCALSECAYHKDDQTKLVPGWGAETASGGSSEQ